MVHAEAVRIVVARQCALVALGFVALGALGWWLWPS